MNRVDFLGVTGAGKSSVYERLLRIRRTKELWRSPEEVALELARQRAFSSFRSPKNTVKAMLSLLPGGTAAGRLLVESTLAAEFRDAMWASRTRYSTLFQACIESLQGAERNPVRRVWDMEYFTNILQTLSLFEKYSVPGTVLFEDSLSQRAGLLAYQGSTEAAATILNELPLPTGIVHFMLSPEQALERIERRREDKVILMHRGLSRDELLDRLRNEIAVISQTAKNIADKGVPLLEIDPTVSIEEAARKIEVRFLSTSFSARRKV